MNTQNGPDLIQNYLGPNSNGTGKLATLGAEYNVSLARLLLYPRDFDGKSKDIILSFFGVYTHVNSADANFDKVNKFKVGGEGAYTLASWFATSLRLDYVRPDSRDIGQQFGIVSPRLIFRSGWQARDQVVLQYSHFFYGSHPVVRSGFPAVDDPRLKPDADMISLSASKWW
jgi:hypothetical protein